jgi:hypothetical protein
MSPIIDKPHIYLLFDMYKEFMNNQPFISSRKSYEWPIDATQIKQNVAVFAPKIFHFRT